MSLHIYRERIRIIDHHITLKAIGNIKYIANKLHLSPAGTYKFLEEMKNEGFPIAYSKKEQRYCYTKSGKMIGYEFKEDLNDNSEEI